MKRVMVFGTFDHVHKGHKFFLNEAKKHGDYLLVVIARDSNVVKFKGSKPKYSEEERLEQVTNLEIADKVVLGYEKDIFQIIKENSPDVICLGYDQNDHKVKDLGLNCEIVRLEGFEPEKYKSSKLKKQ